MSNPRPITAALKELRKFAAAYRDMHVDRNTGKWPDDKKQQQGEWLRLMCKIKTAEREWAETREKILRLSQYESTS